MSKSEMVFAAAALSALVAVAQESVMLRPVPPVIFRPALVGVRTRSRSSSRRNARSPGKTDSTAHRDTMTFTNPNDGSSRGSWSSRCLTARCLWLRRWK